MGCVTDVPIAKYFYDLGYKITTIDDSFEMIKKIKHNLPHVNAFNINMLDIDKEISCRVFAAYRSLLVFLRLYIIENLF